MPPLLLVLDGNSLTHRAYHAAPMGLLTDEGGQPVWAIKGLIGYVARAAARLRPDGVLVGFDCPHSSVRKDEYPGYKASNPAISDDGQFMAFQMARSRDPAGVGYGIFLYDLEAAARGAGEP